MDLPDRLAEHLGASRLFEGARHVVVACSGGGDSTALVLLLHELSATLGIDVLVCHVAHGLRGAAGDRDARAVAGFCTRLTVPFAYRFVDVPELRGKAESLEAAARRLRYAALLAISRELGQEARVATGHTLDDQAETVLLNLARHAGRSRGGIRPRRADGVTRPLLPFSRAELRAFLLSRGERWREDETNANEALLRNRIRRTVLPALERASPGTAVRLARAAAAWTSRLDSLDEQIDAGLRRAGAPTAGPFPRSFVARLGREAAGRLLLRAVADAPRPPGRAQVRRILDRLFGNEARFRENLAGFRLEADPRTVRLVRTPVSKSYRAHGFPAARL